MAIAANIGQVKIYQEGPGPNSQSVQKDKVTEAASQVWIANSLVQTTGTGASVTLQRCATAATAIYGLAPKSAIGSGASTPPSSLFGTSHYPFDLRNRILAITISVASVTNMGTTNGVTYAGGGTSGVALAPGQQYGLYTCTTAGAYLSMQFLDVTNTTQKVFEIVGIHPDNLTSDNNPRVLVKVMDAALQGS